MNNNRPSQTSDTSAGTTSGKSTHPRVSEMHPVRYTVTTGPAPKLLASGPVTSRTVTTLRGLDETETANLLVALNTLEGTLAHTSMFSDFIDHFTRAGFRTAQLLTGNLPNTAAVHTMFAGTPVQMSGDAHLTLSWIGQAPVNDALRAAATPGPRTYKAQPVAAILVAADKLPAAAARALRAELEATLARYDGHPVVMTGAFTDTVNVAPWADNVVAADLDILLIGAYPDHLEAHERAAWVLAQPGGVLEDDAHRLEQDSDADLAICLVDLVTRLSTTRPEYLDHLIEVATTDGLITPDTPDTDTPDTPDAASATGTRVRFVLTADGRDLEIEQVEALERALALRAN